MDPQVRLLEKMRSDDGYLLIVLDACRYDILDQFFPDLDVRKAYSPATFTKQWMMRAWSDEYDACYVSAVPFIGRDDFKTEYNGSDHFVEVVDVWDWGWDPDLGTVPPEEVRKAALGRSRDESLIVHFVQPHAPYIGDPALGFKEYGAGDLHELGQSVDKTLLRRAYAANLRAVWEDGVAPLLATWENRRVHITADHGEALGDNGYYGHGLDIPPVREVPWVEIEKA